MEGDYRMTRDEHRAPGRLVPLRPGHGRGNAVPGPPQRRPDPFPQRPAYPPSDDNVEEDSGFAFPDRPGQGWPSTGRESDWETERGPFDGSGERQTIAPDRDNGRPTSLPPEPEVSTRPEPLRWRDPMDAAYETQELSTQERHQLLMHTIQLYDDRWKLAGVRANERRNRLEAYLVLRNKHVELKEAMSRNEALIIFIDSRGNTDVREPKKRGLLRRFFTWLFGA
jgi:hypothetical protein